MWPGLVVRVLYVSGLSSNSDDANEVYCVLSTGTCKFTTKNLSGKRSSAGSNPWAEAFLLSPRDLQHATTRPLPPASPTAAVTAPAATDLSSGASSPVLTIELWSSKRWGSDAVTASGELLLAPFLQKLQPKGPALQAKVPLHKFNAKAAAKAAKSGSGPVPTGSPGIESGWVLGVESGIMVLELLALTPPQVPVQLLGPVGSGRAEVAPVHSCNAAWLNSDRPVLHTSGGHLYCTPSVQLIKVTLHGAQGLQNLHVDPVAAAAAAAVINRMAATGESPLKARAERAKQSATSMLENTKVGKNLLDKTSNWFTRKPPSLASVSAATVASNALAKGPGGLASTAAKDSKEATDVTADSGMRGSAVSRSASPAVGMPARVPSVAPPAASPAAVAATTAPDTITHSQHMDGMHSGSLLPPSALHQAARDANLVPGFSADPPDSPCSPAVAAAAAAEVDTEQDTAVGSGSFFSSSFTTSSSQASIQDPVSQLKQALQHVRKQSVDAEAVMAALEENGFHATDAPGGAFVYAKLCLEGTSHVSKVVGLGPDGQAVWNQSFWLAATRPATAGAVLDVELYASKDDKTRGKAVATVKVPLHQLLQSSSSSSSTGAAGGGSGTSAVPWFKTHHTLQASFSDHLHCTLSLTVEAADWDSRAELAGQPRTLTADNSGPQSQPGSPRKQAIQLSSIQQQLNKAAVDAVGSGTQQQQQQQRIESSSAAESAAADARGLGRTDSTASAKSDGAKVAAAVAVSGGSSSSGSTVGSLSGTAGVGIQQIGLGNIQQVAAAQLPAVATLDLAVKAFDTRKPLDVFFVLLLGPYCLVSSTSHSTHHHSWGWHLQVPITEPSDILTLALFAREDQAGGKKKVAASVLTNLFSSSTRLVGKMRVRLSTLTPNTPLNVSMPLQGDRTNLRAGHPSAAVGHLYFHLRVPNLLGSYLVSYFKFATCTPELYLLASSTWANSSGGSNVQECSLEVLALEVQQTTASWLEQQPPSLPPKVFRKVQDDGRYEFTLSRTRANWRRLIALREATTPAWNIFQHLCSWENTLHSGGWYCVILLLGMYPSKVLAAMLLLICIALAKSAFTPPPKSTAAVSLAAAAASASTSSKIATAADAAAAASSETSKLCCGTRVFARLLPARPPPVMIDPLLQSPEEPTAGAAAPTDPYTSLKQSYDGLVQFLIIVQNVIDGWAGAGERLQLLFSWSDQLATAVLLLVLLLLALGLWLLGLQVLITVGLLWVFRHPILRDPLPPPPANFVARMPTQADVML